MGHTDIRFQALDGLRGICALSVVIFHMQIVGGFSEMPFFRSASLFVEMFFVLSGFVLAHTYGSKKPLDFRRFAITRTTRLVPLHWVMLVVFLLFEVAKWLGTQKGLSFNNAPFTEAFAVRELWPNALLIQAWTPYTHPMSFNYPAWSISIEYWMYAIFALVVLVTFGTRKWIWASLAAVAYMMLAVGYDVPTPYVLTGISCFFGGAIVYAAYAWLRPRYQPRATVMTGLELISVLGVVLLLSIEVPQRALLAPFIFAGVVLIFAFDKGKLAQLLSTAVPHYLGRISYSIYMTHAAILFVFSSLLIAGQALTGKALAPTIEGVRKLDLGSVALNNGLALLIVAIVIAVSALTYQWIELPGQKWGKHLAKRYLADRESAL